MQFGRKISRFSLDLMTTVKSRVCDVFFRSIVVVVVVVVVSHTVYHHHGQQKDHGSPEPQYSSCLSTSSSEGVYCELAQ